MAEVDKKQAEAAKKWAADMVSKNQSPTNLDKPNPPVEETPPQNNPKTEGTQESPSNLPAAETPKEPPAIDENKIFREKLKEFGLENEDSLRSLLQSRQPTDEEKSASEKAYQAGIVNEFIASGKTLEQYNEIQKGIAKSDIDLAKESFFTRFNEDLQGMTNEQKEAEFTDYYQLNNTDFSEKQVIRGNKRIADAAKRIRESITAPIQQAEQSLKSKLSESDRSKKWESEIDNFFATQNGDLSTFVYEDPKHGKTEVKVPSDISEQVKSYMKDPKKFLADFQDQVERNGKKVPVTNKQKFATLLLKGLLYDKALSDVAEVSYGKGAADGTSHLPPAPDLSNAGKTGTTETPTVEDIKRKAVEHNKKVMGR